MGISPKEALPPAKPLSQVLWARETDLLVQKEGAISTRIEGMAEFKELGGLGSFKSAH